MAVFARKFTDSGNRKWGAQIRAQSLKHSKLNLRKFGKSQQVAGQSSS